MRFENPKPKDMKINRPKQRIAVPIRYAARADINKAFRRTPTLYEWLCRRAPSATPVLDIIFAGEERKEQKKWP